MKFLPEKSQPETRKEVIQLYVYFVVFLLVFLVALWFEESAGWRTFAIVAIARITENMLSEAWQLGKQKKSDKQEDIWNRLRDVDNKVSYMLARANHLPPVDDPNRQDYD